MALSSTLVHDGAQSEPMVKARHATFIARRLAVSFASLAVAPFFLAYRGAPNAGEALVFACSFTPLASAMLLARTGALGPARILSLAGLFVLAAALCVGTGCGIGVAVAWLVAAVCEATAAADRRLARWTGIAALLSLLVLVAVAARGWVSVGEVSRGSAFVAALALSYALFVAYEGAEAEPVAAPASGARDGDEPLDDLIEDVIVRLDASGSAVRVARSCAGKLGVAPDALLGRGLFEHVHVADRPAFLKLVADAAHGETPRPATVRIRTSAIDGAATRHTWVEMRAQGTADPQNAVLAVLRNIDLTRAHETEIDAARRSIEEAIRSKEQFMANMSHELRTPLNAIIGFSEILASLTLRPVEADKQREYARIINQSGQHLLAVVNSILDMSKLRSGTFSIVPEPFDMIPLVDLCCDMVALKAGEGEVALVRDYPDQLEEITGDKRACKQIILNLLSNAVKFTPAHGSVTVAVRPDGNTLAVTVRDTGVGIGAADLARLGDPFFQATSALDRAYEGTGLGLSVVRGLVGLHGGTIALESELGRGTSIKIRLPLDCRVSLPGTGSATIETKAKLRLATPSGSHTQERIRHIA